MADDNSINIEGFGRVKVDPNFFNLPPAQQDAAVEEITTQLKSEPGTIQGGAQALGIGGAKGVLGLAGMRGDVANLAQAGGEYLGRAVGLPESYLDRVRPVVEKVRKVTVGPTSQELQGQVEGVTGKFYSPRNRLERYIEKVGEFSAGAAVPFGGTVRSLGREAVSNIPKFGVAPAVVSEFAGEQAQQHAPALEPYVRGAAAVGTGGAAAFLGRPSAGSRSIREAIPGGITAAHLDAAENMFMEAQRAGMPITRAEAMQYVTGGATRLGDVQRVVEGQGEMRPFFAQRPEQTRAAVERVATDIDPIATQQPQTIGPAVGEAAGQTVTDARQLINRATDPAYTASARVQLPPHEMARVRAIPGYPQARDAVRNVNDPQLARYVAGLPENSVGFLHEVRKYMAQQADAVQHPMNVQANQQRYAGWTSDVAAIDRPMRGASHSYSVAQDVQAEARQRFLEPLMQGPIGRLAKEDITTRQAVEALFPAKPIADSADAITTTVTALAQRNPEAARALVAQHAKMAFDNATRHPTDQFAGGKTAQSIRGHPQQAANLEAAVRALPDGNRLWEGFDQFLRLAEAQATRQHIGSQTAFNQEVLQELKRGTAAQEMGMAAVTGGLKIPQRVKERLEMWRARRGAAEIADLLTNPEAAMRFRQIAELPRGSQQAARVIARLVMLADTAAGPRAERDGGNEPLRVTVRSRTGAYPPQ